MSWASVILILFNVLITEVDAFHSDFQDDFIKMNITDAQDILQIASVQKTQTIH
jgi:hypothetical protein